MVLKEGRKEGAVVAAELFGESFLIPGLGLVTLGVINAGEFLFTSGNNFPQGSNKVLTQLEKLTAILCVVWEKRFKQLDDENPVRAVAGALISNQAFILEHVIGEKIPNRDRARKEKSFTQQVILKRSGKLSEENEDLYSDIEGGFHGSAPYHVSNEKPKRSKSVFGKVSTAAKSVKQSVGKISGNFSGAVSGKLSNLRGTSMLKSTEVNAKFEGFDFETDEGIVEAIKLFSSEYRIDENLENRLYLLTLPLQQLGIDSANAANEFFQHFNTAIRFKTESVHPPSDRLSLRDFDKVPAFQKYLALSTVDPLEQIASYPSECFQRKSSKLKLLKILLKHCFKFFCKLLYHCNSLLLKLSNKFGSSKA